MQTFLSGIRSRASCLGQKCTEWSMQLVFGAIVIPMCFDEVRHDYVLDILPAKGMEPGLAAWFVRHVRASVSHLRFASIRVDSIRLTRGIPQGSKYGPSYALQACIAVWTRCSKIVKEMNWVSPRIAACMCPSSCSATPYSFSRIRRTIFCT
eukprot:4467991-Pyramimonas_sp.AAC.1